MRGWSLGDIPVSFKKKCFFPEHFTAICWKSVYYIEPEDMSQAGEMAQPDSKPDLELDPREPQG